MAIIGGRGFAALSLERVTGASPGERVALKILAAFCLAILVERPSLIDWSLMASYFAGIVWFLHFGVLELLKVIARFVRTVRVWSYTATSEAITHL
jgi:hypothetical protein